MPLTQNFLANVFENIGGALDSNFARQNRIFIFDGENTFVPDVHIRLNHGLPKRRTVAVADGTEGVGCGFEFALF